MALATYTSTVWANLQPKAVHAGNQSVSGQLIWGATSTVGDVGFLCKVPHGATIVDFIEDHSTGATSQGLKFGYVINASATYSAFIAAGAQATVNRRSVVGGLPITISASDDAANRYATITAKVASGTTTTSLIVNFTVIYRMDS